MIRSRAQAILPELTAIRRDLHRYAEPGWLEMRTTSLLARKLTDLGYEVLTGPAVCKADARMGLPSDDTLEAHYKWAQENGADPEFLPATRGGFTGVIATMHCGEGPTIALRFDIDALGVLEADDETHLPAREGFRSVTPGIMHACGHDGHAAIGIGTAMLLRELRDQLHGTVRLIFQPAEEGEHGADEVIATGLVSDVDAFFGLHVWSLYPTGTLHATPGGIWAEPDMFKVTIHGKGGHGATPEVCVDAITAGAAVVQSLQTIVSRFISPMDSVVVTVGSFHAGTRCNIIAQDAVLEGTLRAFDDDVHKRLIEHFKRIITDVSAAYGCTAEAADSIEAGVARAEELGGEGPVCALGTLYFSGDVRQAFARLNA